MQVEIRRLSANPLTVEVPDNARIRDVFDAAGSGQIFGEAHKNQTLSKAASDLHGGVGNIGTIRINGAPIEPGDRGLDTPVTAGSTILIVPKIKGGR